jgi:WD40 repeat protein
VFHWGTGEPILRTPDAGPGEQVAFHPTQDWLARGVHGHALRLESLAPAVPVPNDLPGEFAGGVAISPDGRVLIAAHAGHPRLADVSRWSLPALKPISGFADWSPFRRLAFSPNGQFIAGIWSGAERFRHPGVIAEFELRFAVTGGFDHRHRQPLASTPASPGFVSFTRDSTLCAFGWVGEFYVRDISTGTSREVCRVEATFRDAAFTGSGQHFATVEGSGRMKLWEPKTWQVVREYDWGCGALTCLAFTADGSAGVCGTADGRLVQFDVDE